MRKTIFAVLASIGVLSAAAPAEADLLTPLLARSEMAPPSILVSDGCGFGGHRDRRGRCHANYDEDGALYAYRHYGRHFFRRHGYDAPDY